jgi:hypothetical protein
MDELIDKYIQLRDKSLEYQKKLEDARNKIKQKLKEINEIQYCKNGYEVKLYTHIRSSMNKKDTPSDIWEKYAVMTKYDVLNVKKN